jgi:diguanylate cyclase (GGDEF)-like protein/PAS domain S-box-containing protein
MTTFLPTSSSITLPTSPRRPRWPAHVLAVGLLTALAILLVSIALHDEHRRQRERAQQVTQNVAGLLQGNVEALFNRVDLLLQMANETALEKLDAAGPAHAVAARAQATSGLDPMQRKLLETAAQQTLARLGDDRLAELDGRGVQLAGTPAPSPVSIATHRREPTARTLKLSLLALDGDPAAPASADTAANGTSGNLRRSGLIIEGPVRIDGDWVLRVERLLLSRSKQPMARMQARLPVEHLEGLFDHVDLGHNGAATLRSANLALVWRQPWPAGPVVVGDRQVSPELLQAIKLAPLAGSYVATTLIDNVERINSYRKVGDYPFFIIVGVARDDFPGHWNPLELSLLGAAILSLGIASVVSVLVYRTSRRQIDATQRRFEAIVMSSFDAIISKSLDGRVRSWNPAAEAIFGYSADEMIGQPIVRIIPPERRHEEDLILQRIQKGEIVEHFDTMRQRKDGSQLAVAVTISPLRDADGRIVGASKIARDISRQKAVETQMRNLAFNDPLTGLANRRLLFDRLHQAQAASRRTRQWAALIYIDLDHFKQINDSHGHDVGDKLLVDLAQRLTQAIRGSDTVARMGGDEFVVLCPDLGGEPAQAQASAQGLLAKLSQLMHQPCVLGQLTLPCSASLGMKLFIGSDADMDVLVKQADSAMYEVKLQRRAVAQQAQGPG